MKDFPPNDPWAPGIRASHVRAASDGNPLDVPTDPWEPGVRAIDVPITPGGFPSPFADLDDEPETEAVESGKPPDPPDPPNYSFDKLPAAFDKLKQRRQWVSWKYEERTKENGETYQTKAPVSPNGNYNSSVNRPRGWGTYDAAVQNTLRHGHAGVGYVLIKDDDISGFDLDDVRDPVTGAFLDWVQEAIDLGETYAEISPSGRGVRMFWEGKIGKAIANEASQVEIYSIGRYLTVTGHHVAGAPDRIGPAPKTLELLKARVEKFAAEEKAAKKAKQDAERAAKRPGGERTSYHGEGKQTGTSPFWRSVKDAALANLDAWVPAIFPEASYQPGTGAYRIKSSQLGRNLQEDLAIHPGGITDWGTRETLTAIDLVMWRNGGTDKDAAFWLCDRLGRSPDSFGWNKNLDSNLRPFTHPLGTGAAQGRAKGTALDQARAKLEKILDEFMEETLYTHELWSEIGRMVADYDVIADAEAKAAVSNMTGDPAKIEAKMRAKKAEILATYRAEIEVDIDLKAPHEAIKITTGVGKSRAIRRMIAHFIRRAKSKGLPHRVLYLVGTHRLADEAKQRLPDGVTSAIWQGRGAVKLGTDDEPMCLNLPAVEAAIKIAAEVEKTACRKAKRGADPIYCPFYKLCHYQAQKALAERADVVFAAHELLLKVPSSIGEFGMVIADEAFWQDALFGTAPKSRLVISSLADDLTEAPVRDYSGNRLGPETDDLRRLIGRLQGAFDQMGDGYVTRQPLVDAGLMPSTPFEISSCARASKMEWDRKNIDPGLSPDASDDIRQKAVIKYSFLGRIPKRAAIWRALHDLIESSEPATGRLKLETVETDEGRQRYIRVLGRKEIAEKLIGRPMIVSDATLPLELVRHFLPDLKLSSDIAVDAPFMRITQVAARGVGKSALQPLEPGRRTPEKEAEVTNKRRRLVDSCRHLTQGCRSLIVSYKSIEADFTGIEGAETGHYSAIEGIDKWGSVEVLITIGRPLPSPEAIERMAAAVTGNPVVAGPTVEQWKQVGPRHALRCRVYSEPEIEMIRQAVTEAAIVQAVGRARGVNRTEADPVEVFLILGDTVTDLPGHRTRRHRPHDRPAAGAANASRRRPVASGPVSEPGGWQKSIPARRTESGTRPARLEVGDISL
jgi:hypothetical protein